jgi:hypothetical protein
MGLLITGPQTVERDVGIELSCGQGGVTEKLLDSSQIGTPLKDVGGCGVPKPVGSDLWDTRNSFCY